MESAEANYNTVCRTGSNRSGGIAVLMALIFMFTAVGAVAEYQDEFSDTVTINSAMLPYNVPKSNILILTDGNLYTSGTGINVGDAHYVKIDGQGDTLFFGSSGADDVYGIKLSWSPEYIQIKNMTIIHNVPDNSPAEDCGPIHIFGDDSVLVENVNMVARGVAGNCIDATIDGGNGISNLWVKDCRCSNKSHSFSNRDGDPAAAFRVCADGKTHSAEEYTGKFENVVVTETPHSAIYTTGGIKRPKLIVNACSLTVDARNEMYDTTNATIFHCAGNAFAISTYKLGAGSEISYNYITSGTSYEGGHGIMIQGAWGTETEPIEVHHNTLELHHGPNTFERRYGGDGKVEGLYMRWPAGNTQMSNQYVKFHNNTIKAYADAHSDLTSGTLHTGSSVQALRIHCDSGFHHNEFYNNRVFALRADSLVDTGQVSMVCAMIGRMADDRPNKYSLGVLVEDVHSNVFKNNYYYSNGGTPLWLGSVSNHELGGGGLTLVGDTLYRADNADDSTTVVFPHVGSYRYSSTGSRLVDCVFMGYSSDDDVVFNTITEDDDCRGKDLRFQRIVSVRVRDESAQAVNGAQVWITNNYGQTVGNGYTNASGWFEDTVTYKALHYNSPNPCYWEDSLNYNNFTIKTRKGTDSSQTVVAVNATSTFPVNLTISGGGADVCETAPTVPGLNSPANGATVPVRPNLCVNNSSGGLCPDNLTYDFQVSTNSSMSNIVAQIYGKAEGGGTTCYSPSFDLNPGQTYYWRVRSYNGTTYSSWMAVKSFVVESPNSAPSAPVPNSPASGGTVSLLRPVLKVNNSTDVDGDDLTYSYQVSTNSSFTNIVSQISGVAEGGGSTTSWTVSINLVDGNTYYWRSRAYDGQAYSNYSSTRAFSVDLPNNPPSAPGPTQPTQGAVVSTLNPVLTIGNSSDSDGDDLTYMFQISSVANFSTVAAQASNIAEGGGTTTSWTVPTTLSDETLYYWRARAYDGADYSGWSVLRSFTVQLPNNAPSAPIPSTPSHGEHIASLAPILTVLNSADLDEDDLTYHFQVSTNSAFTQIVAQASGVAEGGTSTQWQVSTTLNNNTNYWWRARAYDGEDYSDYSQVRVFYVEVQEPNDPPDEPGGSDPPPGGSDSSTSPVLTVNNASDPEDDPLTYHFEVWNDARSQMIKNSPAVTEDVDGTTSWQVDTTLACGASYNWRCRTFDGNQYGNWMDWSDFEIIQINTPPTAPTAYSPEDGDTLLGSNHELVVVNAEDADGDDLSYEFKICSDPAMNIVIESTFGIDEGQDLTTSYLTSFEFEDGEVYCWQARVYDGENYSAWSEVRSFRHFSLVVATLEVPTPVYPLQSDTVRTIRPQFTIQIDENGEGENFYFELADNPQFNLPLSSGAVYGELPTTNWSPSYDLNANTTYYWRARAEQTEWSQTVSFELGGNIHVIPNPYKPAQHGNNVVFKNIPSGSEIRIMTIAGDIVRVLDDVSGPDVSWDCTNSQGSPVATGVYLYYVIYNNGMYEDKLAVIR